MYLNKELIKVAFIPACLIFLAAMALALALYFDHLYIVERDGNPKEFCPRREINYRWLDVAAKYHGTDFIFWSRRREAWVFIRDDQECLAINKPVAEKILKMFSMTPRQKEWLQEIVRR